MKIFIPNQSKQSLGGGWTFINNFTNAARQMDPSLFAETMPEADIVFIAGATMIDREFVERAKKDDKKIVLRVDNAPRNSRNRNTGTSRLKDFAEMADLVIYQSEWARMYLANWLGKDGPVILNGADDEIFNTKGEQQPKEGEPQFLFAQYNRDETKRWHEAWYEMSMAHRQWPNSHLWIVGNFSPEQREYNFDFFMGEQYRFVGILERPEDMAEYLRATDWLLLPYYNDACSNTLIEARLCGVEKVHFSPTGGTPEIMAAPLERLTARYMTASYLAEFHRLV
jgi:glycosyltransferase involved in cell wall biosynthesis